METALPSYSNFASVHRPGRLHKLFAGKLQGAQTDSDASLEELEAIILSTIVKRDNSTIDISAYNISANDFRALFDNVLKKHPELLDVATNRAYGDQQLTSFHAEYLFEDYSYDDIMTLRQNLANGIAHAMSWIPKDATDLEKVKAVHDWLCAHVDYDYDTESAHDGEPWEYDRSTTYGLIIKNGIDGRFYPYWWRN